MNVGPLPLVLSLLTAQAQSAKPVQASPAPVASRPDLDASRQLLVIWARDSFPVSVSW